MAADIEAGEATITSMSMIGFAASPGTDVLPTCSTQTATSRPIKIRIYQKLTEQMSRQAKASMSSKPPLRAASGWCLNPPFAAATVAALFWLMLPRQTAAGMDVVERQADEFVGLCLALDKRQSREVDAYFGPPGLQARARAHALDMTQLLGRAQQLRVELDTAGDAASARVLGLQRQVRGFAGLLQVIDKPGMYSFDAQTRLVYGMDPVAVDPEHSRRTLRMLQTLLPGPGSLASRVASFQERFVVPADRRKAVFERALAECRARTIARWKLPPGEQLDVEWTATVDAAWHRYQGHYHSTLQLNPAAVAFLGSAIDVACHEAYPGHHAQFVVMEAEAGQRGLPVEDTVVLLRSPISMLREGAANYGVDLAFPPSERLAFERDVLFPLAGLDPAQARKYGAVHRLVLDLGSNVVPILRNYRDKRLAADSARKQLESVALISSPQALLSFVDDLGPYVLGYTVVRDKVRAYVEERSGASVDARWATLRRILAEADVAALSSR
jgi:hypothetical protein